MPSAYPQNAYLNYLTQNQLMYNPQPIPQPIPQSGFPSIDTVAWVQGEGSAKAYNVPANKTFMLIDSETDRFYIKTTDPYGRPLPLKSFHYSADEPEPEVTPSSFVTREEFETLKKTIADIKAGTADSKDDEGDE